MSNRAVIGFDRRLDIEWLDAVAAYVAAGHNPKTTREKLYEILDGKLAGGNKDGSACYKTVNVLSKTWSTVSEDLVPLRDQALTLLPTLSPSERIALHWTMLLAGYRFFGDIADITGRLLSLQGSLTQLQLTRRMRESWGERSTLDRTLRHVVRSMVQWGVIQDTERRGQYSSGTFVVPIHGDLAVLLVEGLLLNTGMGLPLEQVSGHHTLFPFEMRLSVQEFRSSARLDVHRQGLDVEVVEFRHRVTQNRGDHGQFYSTTGCSI